MRRALTALNDPFDAGAPVQRHLRIPGRGSVANGVITINFIGTRELLEGLIDRMAPGAAIGLIASLAAVDVQSALG